MDEENWKRFNETLWLMLIFYMLCPDWLEQEEITE